MLCKHRAKKKNLNFAVHFAYGCDQMGFSEVDRFHPQNIFS